MPYVYRVKGRLLGQPEFVFILKVVNRGDIIFRSVLKHVKTMAFWAALDAVGNYFTCFQGSGMNQTMN